MKGQEMNELSELPHSTNISKQEVDYAIFS